MTGKGLIYLSAFFLIILAFISIYIIGVNSFKKTRRYKMAYYFLLPTILGMLLIHLLPIVQAIWMSFLDVEKDTLIHYLEKWCQ